MFINDFTGVFSVLNYSPGSASKVIYGTLIVATMILFIFYTSVFTSFLTYQETVMPIKNIDELVQSKEYSAITVRNTKYEEILSVSKLCISI